MASTEFPHDGDRWVNRRDYDVTHGAFCQIAQGKEGLIHISELTDHFVKEVEQEVKVGDEVKVKVIGIDQLGRINLSRKQAKESHDLANNSEAKPSG